MCGIAGVLRFDGAPLPAESVAALGRVLAHRGPDGGGVYRSEASSAVLVHRRLAIIDPHERSAQPMATADGRFRLVFNGEIYNYRTLRQELAGRGAPLRTESDTEVVLELLARDGPEALGHLRGMFALALWDEHRGRLLLARDRFGIKPLYVAPSAEGVAFASEITALTRSGLVSPVPSPDAVLAYLSWASVPPPMAWARGVEPLESGTWREWDARGASRGGYFVDARAAYVDTGRRVSEADLRAQCAAALADTVSAHLVADVPVGIFLSGGIDSGAILSTARHLGRGALRTFTVAVDEASHSEAAMARAVADRFGATHHELHVEGDTVARDLDRIVAALDQPTADAVNGYCVARAVAQTGIKTVLSGVGGDEMFGGYPSFSRIRAAMRVRRASGPLLRAVGAAPRLPLAPWRAAKLRQFAASPSIPSAYRALRGYFMPSEIQALAGPALREPAVWASATASLDAAECALFEPAGEETTIAAVARLETRGYLRSQLLRDLDAVSMAHGLEVRTPFVDHELQAIVWPALGHHPALLRGKRLLHESLALPLPAEVVTAPKRGFTLPFDAWMRGPLRDPIRAGLDALAGGGWVRRDAAEDVWRSWERRQAHWSRPWGLAILGRFLSQTT